MSRSFIFLVIFKLDRFSSLANVNTCYYHFKKTKISGVAFSIDLGEAVIQERRPPRCVDIDGACKLMKDCRGYMIYSEGCAWPELCCV